MCAGPVQARGQCELQGQDPVPLLPQAGVPSLHLGWHPSGALCKETAGEGPRAQGRECRGTMEGRGCAWGCGDGGGGRRFAKRPRLGREGRERMGGGLGGWGRRGRCWVCGSQRVCSAQEMTQGAAARGWGRRVGWEPGRVWTPHAYKQAVVAMGVLHHQACAQDCIAYTLRYNRTACLLFETLSLCITAFPLQHPPLPRRLA